jgi:hypothetical protein
MLQNGEPIHKNITKKNKYIKLNTQKVHHTQHNLHKINKLKFVVMIKSKM